MGLWWKARQVAFSVFALGLASIPLHAAGKAKKHPAPKHPEAVHAAPQKGVKHSAPKATRHSAKKVKRHKRGQMAIDNARAQEIQQALVRANYLKGEPSGTWDTSTQEAMRRYQAEQGWQTKQVPDSRALIKLGLGPDKGRLLNPDSAMTAEVRARPSTSNLTSVEKSTAAGANAHGMNSTGTPAAVVQGLTPSH
jgi:hypothetical protein